MVGGIIEKVMNRRKLLVGWSMAVGAMDAVTGILLVLIPGLVLGLLGIDPPGAEAQVFLSWIGVFVASVGLSYGLVALGPEAAGAVWLFTALVRMMVAVFLTVQVVFMHRLEAGWLLVGVSDALVALVQLVAWRQWKGGEE